MVDPFLTYEDPVEDPVYRLPDDFQRSKILLKCACGAHFWYEMGNYFVKLLGFGPLHFDLPAVEASDNTPTEGP